MHDLCLDDGVLRESEHGFSTRVWMGENNLMPIYIDKQAKPKTVVTTKPTVTIETENDLPDEPVSIKKESSTENYLSRPINAIKEYVRPNVRLTREELEKLKARFSDAEVSKMLDILSDYKSNSGRDYPSDYQALQRWVLKKIYEDRQRGISTPSIMQAEPLPDWVYGNRK